MKIIPEDCFEVFDFGTNTVICKRLSFPLAYSVSKGKFICITIGLQRKG
jgi:hypothetical protein